MKSRRYLIAVKILLAIFALCAIWIFYPTIVAWDESRHTFQTTYSITINYDKSIVDLVYSDKWSMPGVFSDPTINDRNFTTNKSGKVTLKAYLIRFTFGEQHDFDLSDTGTEFTIIAFDRPLMVMDKDDTDQDTYFLDRHNGKYSFFLDPVITSYNPNDYFLAFRKDEP